MLITLNPKDLMQPRKNPVLTVIAKRFARVMIHLLIVLHVILVCSHLYQTTPTFCSQIHHPMHVETVCLLSKLSEVKNHISVKVDMNEMDLTAAESKATYQEIKEWVKEKYGFHVSHLNIAKTKRKCGIIERKNYNLPKNEDSRSPETPKEKEEAITEAFRHFQMI